MTPADVLARHKRQYVGSSWCKCGESYPCQTDAVLMARAAVAAEERVKLLEGLRVAAEAMVHPPRSHNFFVNPSPDRDGHHVLIRLDDPLGTRLTYWSDFVDALRAASETSNPEDDPTTIDEPTAEGRY